MKVFVLSLNHLWNPHFETELEIIANHQKNGDDVFVLTDYAYLHGIISNPYDSYVNRIIAKNRFYEGMRILPIPRRNILFIKKNALYAHLLPKYFDDFNQLRNYSLFEVNFGQGVVSTIVSVLEDHEIDVLLNSDWIYKILTSSLLVYESVIDVIEKYKPEIFYIFNGRFAETLSAVNACKQKGVNFFTHERGRNIYTYLLCKNSLPHSLSYLKNSIYSTCVNFDEDKMAKGKKWFLERRNGIDQGWMSFIKEQRKNILPTNFDFKKKSIAIFNSSLDEYVSFKEWQPPFYLNEIEGLRQIFNSFEGNSNLHFYLRVHPNLKGRNNTQIKLLNQFNFKNLSIIWPEDSVDTYTLAEACDTTLTFSSTMGVEANFWGKPVILAGRSAYENLGCCYCPENHQDVVNLLNTDLKPLPIDGALMYGYWQATRGIEYKYFEPIGFFDGKFMGKKIEGQFSFMDKVKLKIMNILEIC